jgi:hypothetical protein
MIHIFHALKLEASALTLLLVTGGIVGLATGRAATDPAAEYQVIAADDLEPFRSAFNAHPDHIRLVLLIGPT